MSLDNLFLLLLAATALPAQESTLSVSDPSWKGIQVRFLTKLEPPGANPGARLPGGVVVDHGRVHHMITDHANKRAFGYDLRVEPDRDGSFVQLFIEPMQFMSGHEVSPEPGYTVLALPRYPVIPKVRVGDTVALDLMVNRSTGQKIVDYLTVTRAADPLAEPARDFTLADIDLTLDQPHLQVNGKLVEASADTGEGIRARFVWLYVEGHGRFVISLFPNDRVGLRKNGATAGNALVFREGPDEYRVDTRGAIAPGEATFNLYVLHQPSWTPGRTREPFTIGGADRLEYIIGGKR